MTSASADRVVVEEEMALPAEDTGGAVEDEEDVVLATVGSGCETDRLRPSPFVEEVLLLPL